MHVFPPTWKSLAFVGLMDKVAFFSITRNQAALILSRRAAPTSVYMPNFVPVSRNKTIPELKPPIDTEYANTIYEEWKLSTALNSTVVPSFWDSRNKWLWNNAAIFKILYDKQGSAHHEITTVEDLLARSGT